MRGRCSTELSVCEGTPVMSVKRYRCNRTPSSDTGMTAYQHEVGCMMKQGAYI